jgi:hypothetical protein
MAHEGKWQLVRTDKGEFLAIPPQLDVYQKFWRSPEVQSRPLRR